MKKCIHFIFFANLKTKRTKAKQDSSFMQIKAHTCKVTPSEPKTTIVKLRAIDLCTIQFWTIWAKGRISNNFPLYKQYL